MPTNLTCSTCSVSRCASSAGRRCERSNARVQNPAEYEKCVNATGVARIPDSVSGDTSAWVRRSLVTPEERGGVVHGALEILLSTCTSMRRMFGSPSRSPSVGALIRVSFLFQEYENSRSWSSGREGTTACPLLGYRFARPNRMTLEMAGLRCRTWRRGRTCSSSRTWKDSDSSGNLIPIRDATTAKRTSNSCDRLGCGLDSSVFHRRRRERTRAASSSPPGERRVRRKRCIRGV